MIGVLGDIHGDLLIAESAAKYAHTQSAVAIIQVGDWGWGATMIRELHNATDGTAITFDVPIYAIDGNHEDHTMCLSYGTTITEVYPNLFFVPRGTVLELDGRTFACLGGAASVDKAMRVRNGWHWSEFEDITDEEVARLDSVSSVDMLITHVPPQSVIQAHFNPRDLLSFGLPVTWRDHNADKVEALWNRLGNPYSISGHMHKHVKTDKYMILDIDELCLI